MKAKLILECRTYSYDVTETLTPRNNVIPRDHENLCLIMSLNIVQSQIECIVLYFSTTDNNYMKLYCK